MAASTDFSSQLDGEVNELKSTVNTLTQDKKKLTAELAQLTETLAKTRTKIKGQDLDIQKKWFFNGAMVLGVGLILGLILPRVFARRRGSMDNWS